MDNDYLYDLDRFKHQAHKLPRKGFVGENVFYDNWVKLMKTDRDLSDPANQMFADVLSGYGHRLDERAASVAATFVAWLGTNLGYSYRHAAKELGKKLSANGYYLEDVYLMAWARENVRRTGVSYGRRQLEALMTWDDKNAPEVTAKDYEVVEQLVMWLGSAEGQAFLTKCEEETACRQRNEEFRTYLEKTAGLPEHHVNQILRLAKDYKPVEAK